jgi:hypothetical protein
MFSRVMKRCVLPGLLMALAWSVCAHAESGSNPTTNAIPPSRQPAVVTATNAAVTTDYQSVGFETLAAYAIKVDWLVNPTNSAFDSLRREGNIPDTIKALHGKKVALQGYLKPLQHGSDGVKEFLLMRNHALCCQTNVPQINEWIHVRMTGPSLPFAHERQFTVCGVLEVGEVLGAGNVVSVYRLTGDKISAAPETH